MRSVRILGLLLGFALLSCSTLHSDGVAVLPPSSPSPLTESNPTPQNRTLFDKKPQYLCDHLAELKKMPWNNHEHSEDAVYDALDNNLYYSLPCLVDKITDTRPAENPTGAPFMAGLTYRVGDTAVLMLMSYDDMYWPKGMLPTKYEEMFDSEGMFAYYYYVHEVPGARTAIQNWWRKWLKTCQPECTKLPILETKK